MRTLHLVYISICTQASREPEQLRIEDRDVPVAHRFVGYRESNGVIEG